MRPCCYFHRFMALYLLVNAAGCDQKLPNAAPPTKPATPTQVNSRLAEDWISKPINEWPQIVLTNHAEFTGHTSLDGASSFLIQADNDRVLAATAAHLIGSAGGVEPKIRVSELPSTIRSWKMFPRSKPDEFVEIKALTTKDLERKGLDWLLFSVNLPDRLPAYPLKVRQEAIQVGESVFLIGCPYAERECVQNVYRGIVTARGSADRFRYDIDPPVDIRGFSGAPIIDQQGYLVGIMTVWFDPKMSGEKFLEAGGEDVSPIYELLRTAN
jgi:hypothetical protein